MQKRSLYMQVNRVQNQPNFGKVYLGSELKRAISKGYISVTKMKMIEKFKNKYENSKITAIIGLATPETKSTRLDAQVYYVEPIKNKLNENSFGYYVESALSYMFGLSPKNFLKKMGEQVKLLEKKLGV